MYNHLKPHQRESSLKKGVQQEETEDKKNGEGRLDKKGRERREKKINGD